MSKQGTISIHKTFAGQGILLTGSTGFLAKAVVEKILRDLSDVEQIYLLIRHRVKSDGSRVDPRDRLREEILRNSAFRRLREIHGENFDNFCLSKITPVTGDLLSPKLGLDEAAYKELTKKVGVVINSAATVVFDERLDMALDLNTMGPQGMLEFARDAGAIFVHVSTAYVSGKRTGRIPEKLLEPMEAIDAQLPAGVPRPQKLEVVEETERLRELAASVKKECEKQLAQKKIAPESEEGVGFLRTALVNAGMRRAQSLGWNDTYTYTKFLGEQLVRMRHGDVPTAIVRPSIIESSFLEPEPGWLDGLRMADPIIIGFGKGRLADFPADEKVVLDIIPADMVVNAILAAAARMRGQKGGFDLFTIASSAVNPLVFRNLYEYVRDYFQKHPMTDRSGKPVPVPTWRFPTIAQYRRGMTNRYLRPVKAASFLLDGPVQIPGTRRMRSKLRTLNTTLEQLLYYVDIYGPYVNLHCRFEIDHCRELLEMLTPEERAQFEFDPAKIRWKNYLQDVHIPGLKRNILRMDTVPRAGAGEGNLLDEEGEAIKRRTGSSGVRGVPQTVVELLERGHEKYGQKPLVEIRRTGLDGGPTNSVRLTYTDMWEKSGALARKLIARLGLHPGDRVALIGENGPEWVLGYMAISRACCTAVPLDRTMPLKDAANLIRLVEAKALLITPTLLKNAPSDFGSASGLPPLLNLYDELNPHAGQEWPFPEASIGDRPLKEPAPESLASILFTSGTTRDPKGVMLSHSNLVSNALSVAEVLEPMENDRFLSVLPLHHAFEFTCGFLIPMYGGSAVHHIEMLRAKELVDTMKLAQITVVLGVPRLFKLFKDTIQTRIDAAGAGKKITVRLGKSLASALEMTGNTSARKNIFKQVHDAFGGNVRLFVSGAAALDSEIFQFFKAFGITITEGYGLTETSPVLAVNPLSAPKAGTVGPAVPGVEIRIQSPNSEGIGEVQARGSSVMQGYWKNPTATEKTFEAGWFKSGDLGRIDKDGYLHITGRLKDVIVTAAGKNVYPDEVEAALRSVTGAKELCVLGLPARAGMGEEVAVVVVPLPDANHDAIKKSIEQVSSTLPSHQRISRIEIQSDDLPKTTTLKIQRAKIRERYIKGGAASPSKQIASPLAEVTSTAPTGDDFVDIARAVAEVASTPISATEINPDMKLQMDLGVDSIGRTQLLGNLELRLGIRISQENESKLFTVRDVMQVVEIARKDTGGSTGAKHSRSLTTGGGGADIQEGLRESLTKSVLQGMSGTLATVFMNTYLRIDAVGVENVPTGGAYILAANHCSHLDSVAIRTALGSRSRGLHVMGARDYFFDTRVKSWLVTNFLNALPFDREENIADSLASCRMVLDRGRAILLFPEGTRSTTGALQPFKAGIGVLAIELDVPVIPVLMSGTFESLPKGRTLPHPKRISAAFGPAVDFTALKKERGGPNMTDVYRRAAAELRSHVERLSSLPR